LPYKFVARHGEVLEHPLSDHSRLHEHMIGSHLSRYTAPRIDL
jgi:hypothetical protein